MKKAMTVVMTPAFPSLANLEKLGVNVHDLEKQLDNIGIEIYKFKNENMEKFKNWREGK